MIVKDIIEYMEKYAPSKLAEKWDNVGLMTGDENKEVKRVLIALDAVESVIDEAVEKKCDMIITHHPLIFSAPKSVTASSPLGRKIIKLIKNDIAVFSAHTNLDIADGGTNGTLARLLGLRSIENLCPPEGDFKEGLGKIGIIDRTSFEDFAEKVKKVLKMERITVSKNKDEASKVAICTGKGGGSKYMLLAKQKGCDVYITGDVGYHEAQFAQDIGLSVIDATHYCTEVIIIPVLREYLSQINEVEFIESEIFAQALNII